MTNEKHPGWRVPWTVNGALGAYRKYFAQECAVTPTRSFLI